jgi:4-amino-4-deoxy-L-arabinose transferase-like glycosyltransferase
MHSAVSTPLKAKSAWGPGATTGICAIFLLGFVLLSWSAVQTKNATIDEPIQTLSGYLVLRYGDFRLVPESPSLWECYAALPDIARNLKIQFETKVFSDRSFDSQGGINWTCKTLYQTPGNNGEAFIRRARVMMLLPAMLLGALIGYWAYKLAGPIAAIVAVGLFSFDPNFIAHSPIVKSDVPLALLLLGLAYSIWQLGRRWTWRRAMAIGALCGIAINTKFSGLLLLPILALLLFVRAMLPQPWLYRNQLIRKRGGRLLIAGCAGILGVAMSVGITWASYGFRFRPASSPTAQMDMPAIRARAILLEAGSSSNPPHVPTASELSAWTPSLIVRGVDFANTHKLLPQAMLGGLLYQHACLQVWPSYLMGRLYGIGRWYYFPMAMLFKTPSATLVTIALALLLVLLNCRTWIRTIVRSRKQRWSGACLAVPLGAFTYAALQSHINIGLRSVLPLYPFLFIGVGIISSRYLRLRPRTTRVTLAVLWIGLITETLCAWPNYISFFNTPSGGQRGGFALLGDSNLDWGQDLKPLLEWHQQHPGVPIFLHYFGVPDPAFFSSDFHNFEFSPDGKPVSDVPVRGGVLAVSANYLQGLYDKPDDELFFRTLGQRPPDQIVGGSIYLFRNPWQ